MFQLQERLEAYMAGIARIRSAAKRLARSCLLETPMYKGAT